MFNTFFNSFQCFCFVVALAHLPQCTLFAPLFCITLCFSFLLGITAVPRETVNKACLSKILGGQIRCTVGDVQVAYIFFVISLIFLSFFPIFDTSHIICIPDPLYSLASSREPLFTHLI